MKISLNHIRFYRDMYEWSGDPAPDGILPLAETIGVQLGAVEEVHPVADRYKGALIVRVVACNKHPQADRLHVCMVDDGGKVEGVQRDEDGHVQVVCGARNVRAGMLAVWLPPGATVPSTYYDIDTFVLGSRELRGVVSNGMLASPKELTISDNHEGILEVDDETIAPGTSFIDAFGLSDDHVLDIENKMFTHRPDCFGMMGVAREIAGIQHQQFTSPDWYRHDTAIDTPDGPLHVEIRNEVSELVPRFVAVPMNDVTVKQSPVWLQLALSKLGIRPVNNIVDLTNYYMILTGQPLHAYDYDKVVAQDTGADHATIVVRKPRKGEKLTLLNGKEIEPREDAIMIATNDKLIGVGGVMGGTDTEVDESTKNIIIECANFDMYSIRRTSMAHGLFTDAVTRFNKGQSPLQNTAVIARIIADVERLAGGKLAGKLVDDNHVPAEVLERGSVHPPVTVMREFINVRLGLDLSVEDMSRLLTNVEFDVTVNGEELTVKAPFWRTDIEIPEDVVEEVGRLYGYDKLPLELPFRIIAPTKKDALLSAKQEIRTQLARFGANEILTYSFMHGDLLAKVGQDQKQAFKLSNALSPDLQYYRMSLTPSLLDKVHTNIKARYSEFALFEIGKAHILGENDPHEGSVPKEVNALSMVFAADEKAAQSYAGAPFYVVREYLMQLLSRGTVKPVSFELLEGADLYGNPWLTQMAAPYEPKRSAVLRDDKGLVWGVVGEFRVAVRMALKLPIYSAGFEIDPLLLASTQNNTYQPLPRFPKVEQDITLQVSADTAFGTLYGLIRTKLDEKRPNDALLQLNARDIYQPDESHKNITLRLTIASYEKTLTDKEVASLLDEVAAEAATELSAKRM